MKLHQPAAQVFVPDGKPVAVALKRITHLGIGAHQDDLEFMAFHGILECYASAKKWFGGVTCTDGAAIQSDSFSNRSFQTQITVQDGDTIAIGGIIQETTTESSGGIP